MVIISLLLLSLVLIAFVMRGAPKPTLEQKPVIPPPQIDHPWSSGTPGETDDLAGPNAVYGPGTDKTD